MIFLFNMIIKKKFLQKIFDEKNIAFFLDLCYYFYEVKTNYPRRTKWLLKKP